MRPRYHLLLIVLFLGITPVFGGRIDFTAAPFDSSIDTLSFFDITVDGVYLSFTPAPQPEAELYWDSEDGFGVRWDYEHDEIEGPDEIFTIGFGGVHLDQVMLTDLFNEGGYLET